MYNKPKPNHLLYLRILNQMTPEQKFLKAMELSSMSRQLFFEGLKQRFPEKNEEEIKKIYLERISRCYNRNY
jgi:hypothetical protein